MDFKPNSSFSIGHYHCTGEVLGKGSFASVYKGINTITKEIVAIKAIDVERITKTNNRKQLDQEVAVMKGMKHENILELYDVYPSPKGDYLYLCLEYCAAGDLSKYLAKQPERRLSEDNTRYFMRQLAAGLRFLRSKQVVHRDLKPQNLLLSVNSSNAITLKIADFGLAKFMDPHSLADTMCGSPLYMAPELLRNQKYTIKADLWSVGIIMFEMLTGSVPFKCKNQVDLMKKIEVLPVVYPEHLKPVTSSLCVDLLFALLRKDIHQRISWDEFFLHPWLGFGTPPPISHGMSVPGAIAIPSSGAVPISSGGVSYNREPQYPPELPHRKRSQSYTPSTLPHHIYSNSPSFSNKISYRDSNNSGPMLSKSPPTGVSPLPPSFSGLRATSPSSTIDLGAKYASRMEEEARGSKVSLNTNSSLTTPEPAASDSFEKDCVIIHSGSGDQAAAGNDSSLTSSTHDEVIILNDLEAIVNRAFIIGDVAEIKAGQTEIAPAFALFIKALSQLQFAYNIAKKTTLQNFALMIRLEGIVDKIQAKYSEFLRKADFLKGNLIPSDTVATAEKILYDYALSSGKEAAIDEEMFTNYARSEITLRTSIIIFEQLLADCTSEEDKKILKTHIQVYTERFKTVKSKQKAAT
eukprot:TRINITY_DN3966_c0_g1_i1.p1 TRINITY_DN3966_c0_g1~~TRINITY_DN3966_c0_g1_i1.p1  ORF type:complete len:636 (+),score=125.14 TRINITY_DN3966_c0_g1_i1:69-1976(+)